LRFTVRRPPTGEVSPCCHRPSGGDVARSVDVAVAPSGSTGFALEYRLALAVSRCDVPARGASLRRVRSRNLLDPAGGFVLQACDELAPATSTDRAVESAFLGHSRARSLDGTVRRPCHRSYLEVLDFDHVEPPRDVGGCLFDPILPPVSFADFQFRDRTFYLGSAIGTAPATRQSLLQGLQPFRLARRQGGCAQEFAGRQRRRHDNPAVDADHGAIARTGDRLGDVRERNVPAARAITSNPVGLDAVWERPREAEPHPSDLGHPDSTKSAVQPFNLVWLHTNLSKPLMQTGFTPLWLAVRAIEEVLHRLREIAERLLLHRLTASAKPPILGASLRQLPALLQVVRSLTTALPVLLLLHREIPHVASIAAVPQQCVLLFRGRQQSEPQHIRTVIATTDIPVRCAHEPLGSGVLHGRKSKISNKRRLR
jgi:hypothetical protein